MLWGAVVFDDDVVGPPDDPGAVNVLQMSCGDGCSRDKLCSRYHILESIPVLGRAAAMPHWY